MVRLVRFAFAALAVCIAVAALPGCGSDDGGDPSRQSLVRVLNLLLPAAGAAATVNVTAGGTPLTPGGLAYGQMVPGETFSTVASGSFNPQVTGSGLPAPLGPAGPIALVGNQTRYIVVVAGQTGAADPALGPQVLVIPEFNPQVDALPAGYAAVRLLNLSPAARRLSLFGNTGAGSAPLAPQVANVGFGFAPGANQFATLPAGGPFSLSVREPGSPAVNVPVANPEVLNSLTLRAGHAYTVILSGQTGNAAFPLTARVLEWSG